MVKDVWNICFPRPLLTMYLLTATVRLYRSNNKNLHASNGNSRTRILLTESRRSRSWHIEWEWYRRLNGMACQPPKKRHLIARFMGPTWCPSGADRTQVGPIHDTGGGTSVGNTLHLALNRKWFYRLTLPVDACSTVLGNRQAIWWLQS